MKEVRVILSKTAEEVYKRLNSEAETSKQSKMMLKAVNDKVGLIKANIHYGNPIAKNLIPERYKIEYEIKNLFRVELPAFWRMLYTLKSENEIEIIAFVIDIINHPEYDKKFGYKRR